MPTLQTSVCWNFLADREHREIFRGAKDNCHFVMIRIDSHQSQSNGKVTKFSRAPR